MMKPEGSFLFCAPDTGRDGMSEFVSALSEIDVVCVENKPAPMFMYSNPLTEIDNDFFVLYFYDLSAKQKHSLYHFRNR